MPRAAKPTPITNTSSLMKTLSRYESEISSILGMLVVAALAVFIFLFIKKFMPKPSITPVADNTQQENLMQQGQDQTYTVKNGQGLSQIAKEVYNDGKQWKKIADANGLKPPYILRNGQVLKVPGSSAAPTANAKPTAAPVATATAKPTKAPVAKTPTPETVPSGDSYTVVRGDSLWKIAQAQYGSGYAWVKIYRANRRLIGKNPGLIYAGTNLMLPRE